MKKEQKTINIPQFIPMIGTSEYHALSSCFTTKWITEGPKTKEFSENLLSLIGARYGVFAPNGTLALYLGLRSLGIGPGDEVIVPDFTFIGSATAVEMTGATPVFIDVNKINFQIDLSKIDKAINKRTKAIMPVHIYGTVADMKTVLHLAKKHKLLVIEDAAQAIGVHRDGKHSGTFGDVGCFSFFADKTITTGEGGFIVTNKKQIYESLLYLRNQGRIQRGTFIHPKIGYNFRMTDMQSAIGIAQLKKLSTIKERKQYILQHYKQLLTGVPGISFFEADKTAELIPFRVCILYKNAPLLMQHLRNKRIEPRTFFYPLHRQPCFSYLKKQQPKSYPYSDKMFPNSVYGYEHGICLPTFPTLTRTQIQYVCDTIKEYVYKRQ